MRIFPPRIVSIPKTVIHTQSSNRDTEIPVNKFTHFSLFSHFSLPKLFCLVAFTCSKLTNQIIFVFKQTILHCRQVPISSNLFILNCIKVNTVMLNSIACGCNYEKINFRHALFNRSLQQVLQLDACCHIRVVPLRYSH